MGRYVAAESRAGVIWTIFQLDLSQETKKFCPNPPDGLNDCDESVLDSCGR
jgi:hypothetical protein